VKHSATTAGNKAFIVNRIGDFGFSLAMFLIAITFGSLDFTKVLPYAAGKPTATLTTIALLLLVGACGKSAQFPLYVWLPDAMEGPTPVSALIHAATMVTAGVYMITRSAAIFTHAPTAMATVACIGLFTAVFAATIGLTQYDIKKVFAYSTVSQLGYMFLGVGVGAFSAGVWHLMTHAFFKALLFLGAGSVIHACHGEQDMRHMGGLKKYAPWTCLVLACASLAISGFPFTSGFYSKDAILGAAYAYAPWMYWVGVITAGITAFYVWRAFWMTFWGDYKGHGHPHESDWVMLAPLVVLAILSIIGGFVFNVPQILSGMFPIKEAIETGGMSEIMLTGISVLFGLAGIGLSYYMYVVNKDIPQKITSALGGVYTLVYNKYFVDEVYDAVIVHPLVQGSESVLWKTADAGFIDGLVNGAGTQSKGIGSILRLLQSGNIRSYATWVVIGAVALIVAMGIGMGGIR
jgi:NADH-quinone oxidoreductase subunit L